MKKILAKFFAFRRKYFPTLNESTEDMIGEFIARFPGKCIICSYHRFGYSHGMTAKPKPENHFCIDINDNSI